MSLYPLLQLLRPLQWAKNTFVFLPLFFSGQMTDVDKLVQAAIAFVAFSLAASSVYCFNDICDASEDRLHPQKRNRPIAAGKISKGKAYIVMALLVTLSAATIRLFCAADTRLIILSIVGGYYVLNIAYCIVLKHIAVVDVFVVAIGFVIRVFAGGIGSGIEISHWLALITFLLALFLAFAKRHNEIAVSNEADARVRKNIHRYNVEFTNQSLAIIAAITMVCYIMYTVSAEVIKRFDSSYLYITSVFVLAGIIRYLQLTIVDVKSGSPTHILLTDRFIQVCIAGWIIAFAVIIYF
jgi:4-hydroxybenzoate polyprenyltransferase